MKTKEEIASVLEMQIKETEIRKSEFKSWIQEQGKIWKTEDDQVHECLKAAKLSKKSKQQEIKSILDQQVREKEEKGMSGLHLSPVESKFNKSLIKSALKVLGEDN